MPVGTRIDQLRIDAHAISRALNASFQHMRYPELFPDLAQIARDPAFVMHHRGPADHFQVRDSCPIGQNFVLHAIGEKRVCFLFAQIFKGQHSDRFGRNFSCAVLFCGCSETSEKEQADRQKRSHDHDVNPGAVFRARVNPRIDIFSSLDSFRCQLKCPCDHERDRKSNDDCEHDQSEGPIRNFKDWENLCRDLDQQPTNYRVRDGNLVNIAPLQLGKEVTRVHFGFSSHSFWKRGSFRSGSNMGSSRSSAGVSGTFSASAPWAGIESSFCKAAIARSGSPICAATRAKNSIDRVPATASFSIVTAAMARSARANAAVLSPRPALVSARSPIRARFSACSLRKDSSSLRVCCQVSWAPA